MKLNWGASWGKSFGREGRKGQAERTRRRAKDSSVRGDASFALRTTACRHSCSDQRPGGFGAPAAVLIDSEPRQLGAERPFLNNTLSQLVHFPSRSFCFSFASFASESFPHTRPSTHP